MNPNVKNTETIFAEIAVELLTDAVRDGSVAHDEIVSEVMTEIAVDNFPGMRWV